MFEFLEEKSKEISNLLKVLEELNENIDLKPEGHPPIWNEDISDIKKFIDDLKEWLDKPRLKEIKDIITELKKSIKDKRNFNIDDCSTYYLEIYDYIIRIKTIIIDTSSELQEKITSLILNFIINQPIKEELDSLLENIEGMIEEINEKILGLDSKTSTFLKLIKGEIESEVIDSIDENFEELNLFINYNNLMFTKASKLLEVAPQISEEILINEYNKIKDIDEIWKKCNQIRSLLDQTEIPEIPKLNKSEEKNMKF